MYLLSPLSYHPIHIPVLLRSIYYDHACPIFCSSNLALGVGVDCCDCHGWPFHDGCTVWLMRAMERDVMMLPCGLADAVIAASLPRLRTSASTSSRATPSLMVNATPPAA